MKCTTSVPWAVISLEAYSRADSYHTTGVKNCKLRTMNEDIPRLQAWDSILEISTRNLKIDCILQSNLIEYSIEQMAGFICLTYFLVLNVRIDSILFWLGSFINRSSRFRGSLHTTIAGLNGLGQSALYFRTSDPALQSFANLPGIWSHIGRLTLANFGNVAPIFSHGPAQNFHTLENGPQPANVNRSACDSDSPKSQQKFVQIR
jgi:hypothetical protein